MTYIIRSRADLDWHGTTICKGDILEIRGLVSPQIGDVVDVSEGGDAMQRAYRAGDEHAADIGVVCAVRKRRM